ncbi:asparagine synthetase B family protein [Subsaxibacter sp. CAU 1640]|uniref:asparagine synthetase B family protein n=1 Tax=Subsaxibacter sp. CAU 1640 TaxID=2933271 RepID=UPI0020069319|nr:asparagine synthetase B family protein [Subsaxibacter sp. CAU 1640]MCK7589897.1 asparagine synthetase B family protein [Subsaxibacter sp. CAU 1640]
MKTVHSPIIPVRQEFSILPNCPNTIDKKALCIYVTTGFFLGDDSFYVNKKVLQPGNTYSLNENNVIINETPNFNWFHEPRSISFKTALDEFTDLFETIIREQSKNSHMILPLSGGLDSRSQAVGLKHIGAEVETYSYSFSGGFKEHRIGKAIADATGFPFSPMIIPRSYLWDEIDDMADINGCYSEFTHPRQMAVLPALKQMQGEFSLGHWGDVLFDRGISTSDESKSEVDLVFKKIVKSSGLELAKLLWVSWKLEGDFETYLKQRIQNLLDNIAIENKSAKIRAFKSMYWAPRWTSVNLSFFESIHPIHLPYYDDRMCQFICTVPETFLADRKLQIEYIKLRNPKVAKIMWQDQKPYNLFNYHKNRPPRNLPFKIQSKIVRQFHKFIGKQYIQRNWELQFKGSLNDEKLKDYLFRDEFLEFIGSQTVMGIYKKFKEENPISYAHAVSMLLTLSVWQQKKESLNM